MKHLLIYFTLLFCACSVPAAKEEKVITELNVLELTDTTSVQTATLALPSDPAVVDNGDFLAYAADPGEIKMYWKKDGQNIYKFQELKRLEPNLKFAMNGGIFTRESAPVGLYVEKGKQLKGIRRYNNPKVNFGLQPQGVFLVKADKAEVVPVNEYKAEGVIYATQSAPMLVLDSKINPKLPRSNSGTIRNGVGLLPDGQVLMVLSRKLVTFREFAQYFMDKGCTSALYLDGGVSEAYLPTYESYGYFGVLIGVANR